MTAPLMTSTMEAHLKAILTQLFEQTKVKLLGSIGPNTTQPMTPLTSTTKFEITTAKDGAREFQLAITLSEQATPDGSPTTGFSRVAT